MLDWLFPLYTNCLACGREDGSSRTCGFCAGCAAKLPYCANGQAVFWYDPPVDTLIHQLKYNGRRYLAKIFGSYLSSHLARLSYDGLVYVPLHPKRQKHRGYNQAELLARAADKSKVLDALVRVKDTATQTKMTAVQRRENVKGAFVLKDGVSVAGKRLVVLDDVRTTGSTLAACAKVLQAAGAKEVVSFSLASVRQPFSEKKVCFCEFSRL